MSTHALYRFFDEAGDLLYVGITMNPAARWKQHKQDKDWWTEVANITVEPHKDRKSVLEAERLAIITERPRYNRQHKPADDSVALMNWLCDSCRSSIADLEGYLRLAHQDLHDAHDWDEECGSTDQLIEMFAELESTPSWQCLHSDCDDRPDTDGYYVDIHRIRSPEAVLAWTLHIHSKGWLETTNWRGIVAPIAGRLPA